MERLRGGPGGPEEQVRKASWRRPWELLQAEAPGGIPGRRPWSDGPAERGRALEGLRAWLWQGPVTAGALGRALVGSGIGLSSGRGQGRGGRDPG